MRTGYDRLYVAYLHYFNVEEDFFECHEVLEELWLEEGRNPLWQGLLQVAVSLYHHGNGNRSGAIKLMEAALEKLQGQPDDAAGIDLGGLRTKSEQYLVDLIADEGKPYEPYRIRIVDADLAERVNRFSPEELDDNE